MSVVSKPYVQKIRETIHYKTKRKQTFSHFLGSWCLFRVKVRYSTLQTLVDELFCNVGKLWTHVRKMCSRYMRIVIYKCKNWSF